MTLVPPGVADEAALLADVTEHDVRLVRFVWCDPVGIIHAKSIPADRLAGKARSGLGLSLAQNALDIYEHLVDVDGLTPVGEIRLVPDLSTYTRLPWRHGRTATLLVDQRALDLSPWDCCPRTFARRMICAAMAEGLVIRAAFENEFYLAERTADGITPYGNGPCYSTAGLDRTADVMEDVVEALGTQGLVAEMWINEYGIGQQEISIRYSDGIASADQQLRFRDTVRGVVQSHGLLAVFGPKPWPDQIGSGMHVHLSLWDPPAESNLMYDRDREGGLSLLGEQFLAGVLEHLPALVSITCPSYLSYARLAPAMWAGALIAWGFDNREAPLRIASAFAGQEEQSTNAEIKACDASANPHLVLGALIAAGLDGLQRGLRLPEPARVDPARLTGDDAARAGVRPLPATQGEALDLLERDEVLMGAMGDLLSRTHLALRRSEFARSLALGEAAVRARTADIY